MVKLKRQRPQGVTLPEALTIAARDVLNGMMTGLDAWLTEIGADRRRVLVSYGKERDMAAEAGGGLKVWNGQPGSLDVDGEWFHCEGAFMERVVAALREPGRAVPRRGRVLLPAERGGGDADSGGVQGAGADGGYHRPGRRPGRHEGLGRHGCSPAGSRSRGQP